MKLDDRSVTKTQLAMEDYFFDNQVLEDKKDLIVVGY